MADPNPDETPRPSTGTRHAAWAWIPTLYFTSGLPYVSVATLSAVMYKNLGVSNEVLSRVTSDLTLPWVLKPLWSPLVELLASQRRWIVATQSAMAVAMFAAAWFIPTDAFLVSTLVCFWLIAIGSATHDIAADGFYMAGMPDRRDQAWFVGIRSSFYRLSMVIGSGALVALAGSLAHNGRSQADAWSIVFTAVAAFLAAIALYHALFLPRPARSTPQAKSAGEVLVKFGETFVTFFQKPGIALSLAYLLLYRIGEAPLVKLKAPFLLDERSVGGLGLSNEQVGLLDGTIGVVLLTVGGILGGIVVSRDGLRRWLVPMALCINLPHLLYVWLAYARPDATPAIEGTARLLNLLTIGAVVGFEQFMYGFGFAGYMLYMLRLARGEHQTAHYALCTGFMALGMMIPGRYAGRIQESLGYEHFFLMVFALAIPSVLVTLLAPMHNEGPSSETDDRTESSK
ncbi:MAG: MFS transporter [Lacipirellulaceae bacterium]